MNPAALYIRRSDVYVAATVPTELAPSCNENGSMSTTIWGVTTYMDVFALNMSLRAVDRDVCFTPAIADGISMFVDYANGASAVAGLGRRSVGNGVTVALMESCVTKKRIDAQLAVSPLPSPGAVHILFAMEDKSKLGEWSLDGESILESSKKVGRYDST